MMRRLLWIIPLSLLFFLIILVIGVGFLVSTPPGARILLAQAIRYAPGHLRVTQVDGTLLSPLSLRGIDYTDENGSLSVDEIRFRWFPIHLLRGVFYIDTLSMEGVRYHSSSEQRSSAPTGGPSLPSINLPLRVVVLKAVVNRITYESGGPPVSIDQVAFGGRIDEHGIQIQSLQVATPQAEVSLSGKINPQGTYPFDLTVTWSANFLSDTPLQGKGEAKGNVKEFRIDHQLIEPALVGTRGTVRLAEGTPTFDLNGGWSKVQWPLTGEATVESADGQYQISGRVNAYQLHLRTALTGTNVPTGLWKLDAVGDQNGATLQAIEVDTLDGKINGHGEIAWQPQIQWALALNGSKLNPGNRWPDWKGEIGFRLDTRGAWSKKGPSGRLQLAELRGKLRGYPVKADANLAVDQNSYNIQALHVQSGEAEVTAAGTLRENWNLRWKVQAPDLAALLPNAAGRLSAGGKVRGARLLPTISVQAQGASLRWTDTKVRQIEIDGLIDLQDKINSSLQIEADGIDASGQKITRLEVKGEGRLSQHAIQVDLRTDAQRASIRLQGGVEGKEWKGALTQSVLQDQRFGKWTSDQPIPMALATSAVQVEKGCWVQGSARFCIAGRWQQQQGWQTEGRAEHIPLAFAKPWLPPEVTLSGTLDGEWSALERDGQLQFKTAWTPPPGKLAYQMTKEESITIPYQDGLLQAELNEGILRSKAQLTLTGYGAFQSTVTLSPIGLDANWRESRMEGTVQAHLDQLEPITAFFPTITQVSGKLQTDFTIAGTPSAPHLTGKALLDDGKARISSLGIDLNTMRLEIRNGEKGALLINGKVRSDPGELTVDGTVIPDASQGWPTRLRIQGERFEAVNLPEVHLLASPDLTLQINGRRIDLNGAVLIPEAEIKPRALPKEAVQVSDDTVVVRSPSGQKIQDNAQGWQIYTHVTIRVGDKVTFNGFGLTGKIAGELLATESPERPTLMEGTLRIVDGKYQAYGQNLDISEGRLIFAGPTDNPGLDIQASRKIELITAGIHVTGTLKRPQSTLFSNPQMDDANTLSYLLLGRPINQASSQEGDLMTKAVTALGIKGGNLLTKKIGRTLGLDEVTLQGGNTPQQTTLVIGKYLSPRFYVSYGIGLFQTSNTFSLRYKLNESLNLRAQSGQENTLDLLYTHEYN